MTTKEELEAYEIVKESGFTDMDNAYAISDDSGLDIDSVTIIMLNYEKLKKRL